MILPVYRLYRLRLARSNSFSVAPGLSLKHPTSDDGLDENEDGDRDARRE
jgi:hypothetical protein